MHASPIGTEGTGCESARLQPEIERPGTSLRSEKGEPTNASASDRIIFLDIDGVLNCRKTPNPRGFPYVIDPLLRGRFDTLLKRTGASVVLSSTWRYDPAGLFSAQHWGVPFIDITPDMPKRPRGDEIREWLRLHPGTTRFLVIDDEDDGLDGLPLFQPRSRDGLTDALCARAAAYLEGTTHQDMRRTRLMRILQHASACLKGHEG